MDHTIVADHRQPHSPRVPVSNTLNGLAFSRVGMALYVGKQPRPQSQQAGLRLWLATCSLTVELWASPWPQLPLLCKTGCSQLPTGGYCKGYMRYSTLSPPHSACCIC